MDKDTFYWQRTVSHRFLRDVLSLCENAERHIDIAITVAPAGGDRSDIEDQDDDNLEDNETKSQEIVSEFNVFYDEPAEGTGKISKRQRKKLLKWKKIRVWLRNNILSQTFLK